MLEIKTSFDFKKTLSSVHMIKEQFEPIKKYESIIRKAISEIFEDYNYIDFSNLGLVNSYLDSIEIPLQNLSKLGIRIYAVKTKGYFQLGDRTKVQTDCIHYIVAPQKAYYWEEENPKVHKFGTVCEEGDLIFIKEKNIKKLNIFLYKSMVEEYFEKVVPWCDTCFLDSL